MTIHFYNSGCGMVLIDGDPLGIDRILDVCAHSHTVSNGGTVAKPGAAGDAWAVCGRVQ